jgi:hypothetical protein
LIRTQNVQTFTKTHLENANSSEKRITYNHGYDLTVNARTGRGTIVQGGINADRSINDTCYLSVLASPQNSQVNPITGERFCRTVTPFRPDVSSSPRRRWWWDMRLSATYQKDAGPTRLATWTICRLLQPERLDHYHRPGSSAAQIAQRLPIRP